MSDLAKHKEYLFNQLQTAIELEHSTIPTYLSAMFTIDENTNYDAYYAIRSVVMEEMLHMTLACNILNAVGGAPYIDNPKFVPEFPLQANWGDRSFEIGLVKFSKEAIETFLEIEKPDEQKITAGPQEHFLMANDFNLKENTIGDFYDHIQAYMEHLCNVYGEDAVFDGEPSKQIGPEQYYGGGGKVTVVTCFEDAVDAMRTIKDQGEGSPGSIWDGDHTYFDQNEEVAHYFMFNQIMLERYYQPGDRPKDPPTGKKMEVRWDLAANMVSNPKAEHFPEGSEARQKADEFNNMYSNFLHLLHHTFNGDPDSMQQAVLIMYKLKYLALELLNIPIGDGKVAGPPFQFVPQELRKKVVVMHPPRSTEEC